MLTDLIDSLVAHDVAHYAGLNPRAVKAEKVQELLGKLQVTNAYQFGQVFNYKKPFQKFAVIYRDMYIFGMDFETARELAA